MSYMFVTICNVVLAPPKSVFVFECNILMRLKFSMISRYIFNAFILHKLRRSIISVKHETIHFIKFTCNFLRTAIILFFVDSYFLLVSFIS